MERTGESERKGRIGELETRMPRAVNADLNVQLNLDSTPWFHGCLGKMSWQDPVLAAAAD